jgi:hypothetical protein
MVTLHKVNQNHKKTVNLTSRKRKRKLTPDTYTASSVSVMAMSRRIAFNAKLARSTVPVLKYRFSP